MLKFPPPKISCKFYWSYILLAGYSFFLFCFLVFRMLVSIIIIIFYFIITHTYVGIVIL